MKQGKTQAQTQVQEHSHNDSKQNKPEVRSPILTHFLRDGGQWHCYAFSSLANPILYDEEEKGG